MDATYREAIIEHYRHPRNYGRLDNPNIHVEAHNPLCGDRLEMDLIVSGGVVREVRFSGRGCALSQASTSMLTEDIAGADLTDLARITPETILGNLGIEVSYARLKCALLPLDLVQQALAWKEAGG